MYYDGLKDETYWSGVKGVNYQKQIRFGYNTTAGGGIVCFGTSAYTIQFRITLDGVIKYRSWMNDNNAWNGSW